MAATPLWAAREGGGIARWPNTLPFTSGLNVPAERPRSAEYQLITAGVLPISDERSRRAGDRLGDEKRGMDTEAQGRRSARRDGSARSEERRVGKECRSGWGAEQEKRQREDGE